MDDVRRRQIVADTLLQRHPLSTMVSRVEDAVAILDALDEMEPPEPDFGLTAEQQIRLEIAKSIVDFTDGPLDGLGSMVVRQASLIAAFIESGAEPVPSRDATGAAEGEAAPACEPRCPGCAFCPRPDDQD